LKAAEKAVEWSMFPTPADSLDFGISLLGIRCWREEYDLSLAIYNCAAEVGYVIGAFAKVDERIEAVLNNARVFDHKLQAIYVKISLLSATAKVQESIDVGLETLKDIEDPRSHPSCGQIMQEYLRSHCLMKNKSSDMLLRLSRMTDHHKAAAMQIINLITLPAIFGRPSLMPLLATRATQITVSHGLYAISALAFGLYGMVLTTVSGEVDEATHFGELALQLLEHFDSKQWLSQVHIAAYGCIFGWTKCVTAYIEPLKRGYDVGIETGDVEVSLFRALAVYVSFL
jgi:predicted ATPase